LPLFEKTRIELYLPDVPRPEYHDLLVSLEHEFTYTFGCCSLLRGLDGNYLAKNGQLIRDRVNILYTDIDLIIATEFAQISTYTDALRRIAFRSLDEEVVLIVVYGVYHSE